MYKFKFIQEFITPGNYTVDIPENVTEIEVTCWGGGGGGAEVDLPSIKHSAPGGYGSESIDILHVPRLRNCPPNTIRKRYLRIQVGKGGNPAQLISNTEERLPFLTRRGEDGEDSSVTAYAFLVPKDGESTQVADCFNTCETITAHGGIGAFLDVHTGCDNGFSIGNSKGGSGGSELYNFYGQPGYVRIRYKTEQWCKDRVKETKAEGELSNV